MEDFPAIISSGFSMVILKDIWLHSQQEQVQLDLESTPVSFQ